MKLSDRLKHATAPEHEGGTAAGQRAEPEPERTKPAGPARTQNRAAQESSSGGDPLVRLKQRAQEALFARLGARLYDASMDAEQIKELLLAELGDIIADETAPLTGAERQRLAEDVARDVLGYGPIEEFLADPAVTEVMVNGDDAIYVERGGRLHPTQARFVSDEHLRRVIERIVSAVGRRIDESTPMVDARLPDGSRVNAIIPPLAVDGPTLTIRKFATDPFTVDDLVEFGTLTDPMARLLRASVEGRLSVLVSGGTGTGKTTMLNVLSGYIPTDERIVTIEDAVELQLQQPHVVRLESRPPNIEGKGQVTIRDLVRNALRMRPDRIVVGEVRGAEALDMLQAMNTGHEGSLSTVHANSPRDAIARVETMVLMAGMDLPLRAIREQIASAVDVIVQIGRLRDGTRRITHLTEVTGMEGDIITLQDVHLFDYAAGVDDHGRFRGNAEPTGIRPHFTERLTDFGIDIPQDAFGAPDVHGPDGLDFRGKRQGWGV